MDRDIRYSISVCVTSFYLYSNMNLEIVLFFFAYTTAIRFPGQFLKSAVLFSGTSDSGKPDFISKVLRVVFSSKDGLLNNSTVHSSSTNEINTDKLVMMRSHVCQCDEPNRFIYRTQAFRTAILHVRRCQNLSHRRSYVRAYANHTRYR